MIKYICSYDDWAIIEYNNKFYFVPDDSEEEVKEVELVHSVPITNETTEEELIFGFGADITGELDNEPVYCYWNKK